MTILWISVAWHRFILLKQAHRAFITEFYFKPTLVYFQKSVLIVLLASLPMLLLFLPYWMYQDAYPYTLIGVLVLSFLLLVPFCAIILFRLTPLLSAAALGHDLGLKAAWTVTRGQTLTLFFYLPLRLERLFSLHSLIRRLRCYRFYNRQFWGGLASCFGSA